MKKKEDCRQRDTPPDYRSAKRCTQRGSRRADAEPHGDAAARTAAPDRRLLDVEAVPAQARLVRVNLRGASLLAKHHHALVARLARFCGAARRRKKRGCSAGAVDGEPAGGERYKPAFAAPKLQRGGAKRAAPHLGTRSKSSCRSCRRAGQGPRPRWPPTTPTARHLLPQNSSCRREVRGGGVRSDHATQSAREDARRKSAVLSIACAMHAENK